MFIIGYKWKSKVHIINGATGRVEKTIYDSDKQAPCWPYAARGRKASQKVNLRHPN